MLTEKKCNHIIGTIEFYNMYTHESADIIIYQSNIDVEDADVTLDDLEERFEYCPLCGQKNSF